MITPLFHNGIILQNLYCYWTESNQHWMTQS